MFISTTVNSICKLIFVWFAVNVLFLTNAAEDPNLKIAHLQARIIDGGFSSCTVLPHLWS